MNDNNPPRSIFTTVTLVVFSIAAVGGAVYVLYRAWISHSDSYWSIALPGVATGAGTLMLAAVTTWLSISQRARENYLRRDDIKRREIEKQADEGSTALREARKVILYWQGDSSHNETIRIVNAGSESIVEVHLIGASLEEKDKPRNRWVWHPLVLEDEFDRYHAPSWYRSYILPASTAEFRGRLIKYAANGTVTSERVNESALGRQALIEAAWSDASGRHWRRTGSGEPAQLDKPYEPSSGAGKNESTIDDA